MQGPLFRIIFPLFVLTMWVTLGTWIVQDDWSGLNWLMLGTAALCCAIVFADFTSIFNYGYALTMTLLPLEVLILRDLSTASLLVGVIVILFGLRLLAFTQRRRTAESFAGGRAAARAVNDNVPTPVRVMLFVFVTTLMTFTGIPVYLVAVDGETTPWVVAGAVLMAVGLLYEAVADEQKQSAKAKNPGTFVRTGLWARTRHPNYAGEIVFQVGLGICALGAVSEWWQFVGAVVAPAYIVVLMCFSAKSGTARMAGRYGSDPEFQDYLGRSRSLLPI